MPVYKDAQRSTWYVKFRYKNWTNEDKWITKRGFKTKRDAVAWEREFKCRLDGDLDMPFSQFTELYKQDRCPRLKESTAVMKDSIIDKKLVPYFGSKPLRDISTRDVLQWQNTMLAYRDADTGMPYSKSYLKTIHNQLSAIFNHAVRFYHLQSNPAAIVGNMGSENGIQMKYWTKEDYLRFSEVMMDEPKAFYAFQMLYWCGIREGEMLALTAEDIDFEKKTVHITKTYHRHKGRDIVTEPKTPKLIEIFNNIDTFFTGAHQRHVATRYRNFFLQVSAFIDQKDCQMIYEALIRGDPKMRAFRALYQRIYGRYITTAKKEEQ